VNARGPAPRGRGGGGGSGAAVRGPRGARGGGPGSGTVEGVADWVIGIVDRLGAAGVGLLIFLENVVPPIPSELILPLAGFRARTGGLDPVLVWPAATVGSVAGALVLYALGRWLGYERLHELSGRRWFVLSSRRDLERGRRWFDAHSGTTVLAGRCVPFVRSVVSIPAGVAGMPLGRFTLLTAIGSGLWNALFLGLGWLLGTHWADVEGWLAPVGPVIVGLVGAGLLWLVVRKVRGRAAEVS
jgi:membrane protein DedA with SNARE-associated domain